MIAAIAFSALIALLCLFQLALACGAPWGRLAWGGQHAGVLPTGYRIGSAVAILVYGFIAALALDRGGILDWFPDTFSRVGMWIVVGFLTLGVVMNALSRSKLERATMTPVALVLAILALNIALTGPSERLGTYTVIDNGSGPVLCEGGVMESYPPQCFGAPIVEWNWDDHPHEAVQGVRWGEYSLIVTRNGDRVLVDVKE